MSSELTLGGGAVALILAVVMSDLFDNVGTSVSVGRNAGMLDEQGRLPRIRTALMCERRSMAHAPGRDADSRCSPSKI